MTRGLASGSVRRTRMPDKMKPKRAKEIMGTRRAKRTPIEQSVAEMDDAGMMSDMMGQLMMKARKGKKRSKR